jgi:hypothetical protein
MAVKGEHGTGWSRRRAVAAGSPGLAAIVLAAIVAAVLVGSGHGHPAAGSGHGPAAAGHGHRPAVPRQTMPLAETSLTPPGWAPVSYLGAQVSVPASWFVEDSGSSVCGGGVRGMIFLGQLPQPRLFAKMGCRLTRSVVVLTSFPPRLPPSSAIAVRPDSVVNGFAVLWRHRNGKYVLIAPSLRVQLTASGPLAVRVLATLTRSPLSVALARAPVLPVPAGWQWHRFGGITLAVPGSWKVERDNWWGGCPFGIAAVTLRLSTAAVLSDPSCPAPLDTAGFNAARPGVVIGAGRYATLGPSKPSYAACLRPHGLRLHGLRACVSTQGYGSGLLTLAVGAPGQPRPVIVEIGLAGSGALARTIIGSIGPATE